MIKQPKNWGIALALVIAVVGGSVAAKDILFSGAASNAAARSERQVLDKINQQRMAQGLKPLRYDSQLAAVARKHSEDMLKKGYFSHGDFENRLYSAVGRRSLIAEDIGLTSPGVTGVVRAWMNSPPHRKNILLKDARRMGIGVALGEYQGQSNTAMVTADFSS